MKFPKNTSTYISIITILLWITIVAFGIYLFIDSGATFESLIFGLKAFMQENLFLGIIAFIFLYTFRPLFFIPASPFDVFSGLVFGVFGGFFVSMLAISCSTVFSYYVGYYTGGIVLEKKKIGKLEKLRGKLTKNTFRNALMMRLLLLPYDLGNYISGLLRAPFWKYIGGTILGIMAPTFVFILAGSAFYGKNIQSFDTLLENVNYSYLIFALGISVSIMGISIYVKKKYRDLTF